MNTNEYYLLVFDAVVVIYTIVWSVRYNKQLKREARERAMNYYRNHFQEKLGPEGHFISLTRAGKERHWLLLDGGFEVQGNAHDIYPDDGLMEEGLAQMDTPERSLEWYRKNFLHAYTRDGTLDGENYVCLSLDAGRNYFYINDKGVFKEWVEDFHLPENGNGCKSQCGCEVKEKEY